MRQGISSAEKREEHELLRAARRSVEDMRQERARMIARHAPVAVIEALDCRIENALRLMRGVEKND